MKNKNSQNWLIKWYPLILILLLATIFRWLMLKFRGDFTFDEAYSAHFSSLAWPETLKYWLIETNPPLYSFLLRWWLKIFTAQEWLIRLPSLIYGLFTILVVYATGLKFFNKVTGIIASLLISLSGLAIYLNTEARAYSLLLLLTSLSIYLFLDLISAQTTNYKKIVLYTIIQTLLLYTNLTAVLIPLLQVVIVLITKYNSLKLKRLIFYSNFIAGLFFSIWLIPALANKLSFNSLNGWYFDNPTARNLFYGLTTLFLNPNISSALMVIFTIFLTFILFSAGYHAFKTLKTTPEEQTFYLFLFALALIPPILAITIGIDGSKYFSISLPPLSLIFAWAISQSQEKSLAIALTIIVSFLLLPSALTTATTPFFSWQPIIHYLEKNETKNSLILINPFNEKLSFSRYYHGSAPMQTAYLLTDNLSLDERIARYNWQQLKTDDKELDQWLKKLTTHKKQIFLIQYTDKISKLPIPWFMTNNWKLVGWKQAKGAFNLYVFEFQAPNYSTPTAD